jgi:DNA modification methylase
MQKLTEYAIDDLNPADYNPRQLTKDQHKQLSDSISAFGFVEPVVVNINTDRLNVIVSGHQRVRCAKGLGIKKVPCVELDLTLEQERELNVRMNKNTGEWDWDLLANGFDLDELLDWGFTEDELKLGIDDEPEERPDDDDIPEVEEAVTKLGDLWLLGEHRLLCGDATKKENVELLMDGNKADMVFTDPPYGNANSGKYGRGQLGVRTIQGDESFDCVKNCFNKIDCKDFVFFLQWRTFNQAFKMLENKNIDLRTIAVWDKKNAGLNGAGGLAEQWEAILFTKEIKFKKFGGNVFSISREYKKRDDSPHPHQKPIELLTELFSFLDGYKKILDPFLGSGSTLIACEKTNRKCYGMELDPHYCDVIVKRWEDYTGNKAILKNG